MRLILSLVCLVTTLLVPGSVRAQDSLFGQSSNSDLYSPHIEFGGIGGDVPEAGQTFLFVPLAQSPDEIFFADLRGLYNDIAEVEGNWGLGYRKLTDDKIFGLYGYLDQRHTQFDNDFFQVTLGAEILREENEARMNVYIPESSQKAATPLAFIGNGNIFVAQGFEAAYYGTDFEYGHLLLDGDRPNGSSYELRGYIGGYYFGRGENGYQDLCGPSARAEFRLFDLPKLGAGSRLVFGGQYRYDDVRGSQEMAFVNLRIPFGGGKRRAKLQGLQRRMVNPVVRDIDIVTNDGGVGTPEQAKFASTGNTITGVTFINGDTMNPEMVFNDAGPDSVVIFNGQIETAAGFIFNNGQAAVGGGGSLAVFGCETGLQANFIAPGSRPTIAGTNPANSVFELANNNTLSGLDITGGLAGLFKDGSGTFQILNNRITGAERDGVAILGNLREGSNVIGNHFDGNGSSGFYIDENNRGLISSNTFNGNMLHGLDIFDNRGTIAGNTANGNDVDGFLIFGDNVGLLANNTANDNGDDGFDMANNRGEVINNTANGNTLAGFYVDGNQNGLFQGNVANGNGLNGFEVQGNVAGIFDGNTSNNNGDEDDENGFFIVGDLRESGQFINNTANGNGDDGIQFLGNIAGLIENNTANGNRDEGFDLVFVRDIGIVRGNTANNNGDNGFEVLDNMRGLFEGNSANGNGDDGFDFDIIGTTGRVLNNIANGNLGSGFDLDGTIRAGSMFNGNTANNNAENGFDFFVLRGKFSNNLAQSNGNDGYNFTNVGATGVFTENRAFYNLDDGFDFGNNNGIFSDNIANFNSDEGYNGGANNNTADNNTGAGNGSNQAYP